MEFYKNHNIDAIQRAIHEFINRNDIQVITATQPPRPDLCNANIPEVPEVPECLFIDYIGWIG